MNLFDDPIQTSKRANKKAQHGCFAHFPGTGPELAKCHSCEHVARRGTQWGAWWYCEKWEEIQRKMGATGKAAVAKAIDPNTSACKYHERRPGQARKRV